MTTRIARRRRHRLYLAAWDRAMDNAVALAFASMRAVQDGDNRRARRLFRLSMEERHLAELIRARAIREGA